MNKRIDEQLLLRAQPILANNKTIHDIIDIEIQIKLLDKNKNYLTQQPFIDKIPKVERTATISNILNKYNSKYNGEYIIKYETSAKEVAKEIGIKETDENYKKISFLSFWIDVDCNHAFTNEVEKWFDVEIKTRLDINTLHISEDGKEFIKGYESEVKENGKHILYNDDLEYCTIGYGHLVDGKVSCANINSRLKTLYANGLTNDEAKALFSEDVYTREEQLKRIIKVPLYQEEFDAYMSLYFNVPAAFGSNYSIMKCLNKKDYERAKNAILLWNKGTVNGKKIILNGLKKRREAEVNIIEKGIYDSSH